MIDMSLWDCAKNAIEDAYSERRLIDIFAEIERGAVRLAVAGKLYSATAIRDALSAGADVAAVGRAAVTNHDFPKQMRDDANFAMRSLPVSPQTLRDEGLSDTFVGYMRNWKGFVSD
jgi:2,4-dienoyl-CoA reductase-like NADH-dependent reductase (Old Yellow Enzyme family)